MSAPDDLLDEEWRPVPGYETRYLVSNLGRVASLPKRTRHADTIVLSPTPSSRGGYPVVSLRDDEGQRRVRGVHQIVLESFVGPRPPGALALHADDDPGNCALVNLRWGSRSDNQFDAVRNGRHPQSSKTHCKRGHEFTPENTWTSPSTGGRTCLACRALREEAA